MVEKLKEHGNLWTPPVEKAFLATRREHFVPEQAGSLPFLYDPINAVPISFDARGTPVSSSSAPSIMAPMLEMLKVEPGQRILEVGAGTGYNAALLKKLTGPSGRVVSVDIDAATARRARSALRGDGTAVTVVTGDGRLGWSRGAPYDRLIVTASSPDLPDSWFEQLRPGGIVVLPLQVRGMPGQLVVAMRKESERFVSTGMVFGGFMSLRSSPTDLSPTGASISGGGFSLSGARFGRPRLAAQAVRTLEGRRQRSRLRDVALLFVAFVMTEAGDAYVTAMGGDSPVGFGVLGARGRSVALVRGTWGNLTYRDSWGDGDARQRLDELMRRWRAFGRTPPRLKVSAHPGRAPRFRWTAQ